MAIICDRCGREMNDRWEIEGMPGIGGNCSLCGDNLCAECAGHWNDDGECRKCQEDRVNAKNEKRVAAIEERVSLLEERLGVSPATEKNIVEIDLTLPEDDIAGLHFNETKVHAVFEKKEDGAYYSRDVLFLSARDMDEGTGRDLLSEYLNKHEHSGSIKAQIALAMKADRVPHVEVFLPEENQGVKRYNGVTCWYWLRPRCSGSAAYFCYVSSCGPAGNNNASAVGGCAPAFRIRRG